MLKAVALSVMSGPRHLDDSPPRTSEPDLPVVAETSAEIDPAFITAAASGRGRVHGQPPQNPGEKASAPRRCERCR